MLGLQCRLNPLCCFQNSKFCSADWFDQLNCMNAGPWTLLEYLVLFSKFKILLGGLIWLTQLHKCKASSATWIPCAVFKIQNSKFWLVDWFDQINCTNAGPRAPLEYLALFSKFKIQNSAQWIDLINLIGPQKPLWLHIPIYSLNPLINFLQLSPMEDLMNSIGPQKPLLLCRCGCRRGNQLS